MEYRFELPIAAWPPTYHGQYLSIDHYVDARAKIPWGFDPKASAPFMMRPTCGPEEALAAKKKVTEVKGVVGCILGIVFLGFMIGFFAMMAAAGPFALFFLLLPLAGFVFWMFRVFLPKYRLGDVRHHFSSEQVSPGEEVSGELIIQPRKNVPINGVTMHFQAREQCVSGSGSNRTTHKNVFFEKVETLQAETTLRAGQEHRFPLSVRLPEDAAYTIDLDDNDLIWSATLRVDIPRWPDWVQEIPLAVVPSGKQADVDSRGKAGAGKSEASRSGASGSAVAAVEAGSMPDGPGAADEDGITFAETAMHFWEVRGNREQVRTLAEAVSGLMFELEAVIERRLLYGGDDDPHVYKDGYAVWAHYTDPELPMVLYVPHELADEFEQAGREVWRGRGTVVGWDNLHGRLQVKLDRPR